MQQRISLFVIMMIAVCLCSSAALAMDNIRRPVGNTPENQWGWGFDYGYNTQDLHGLHPQGHIISFTYYNGELDSSSWSPISYYMPCRFNVNARVNRYYGRAVYGISDRWDAYFFAGGHNRDSEASMYGFCADADFGTDFAFGCGTSVTLYQPSDPNVVWGASAQCSYTSAEGKLEPIGEPFGSFPSGDAHLRSLEVQCVVAPSWQCTEGVWLYGGPFAHWVSGEFRGSWTDVSVEGPYRYVDIFEIDFDTTQQCSVGGVIGCQWYVRPNMPIYAVYQHTEGADLWGCGATWRR